MKVKHKQSPAKTKRKHRKHHPSELRINLDSADPELEPLLRKLNPILKRVIEKMRECPVEDGAVCTGGYHNITYCEHDDL